MVTADVDSTRYLIVLLSTKGLGYAVKKMAGEDRPSSVDFVTSVGVVLVLVVGAGVLFTAKPQQALNPDQGV